MNPPSSLRVRGPRVVASGPLRVALLVALVALALVSAALAWWPGVGGGSALAIAKVAVLAFLFVRIARGDVYTLQWASMLVLLFVAEGLVRAMTDPRGLAWLGAAEAVAATAFFVAALATLRPLKRAARESAQR